LRVLSGIQSTDAIGMAEPYVTQFTAAGDLSALARFQFSLSRLDRATQTVSYDVTVTNLTDRPLLLPLVLQLNPSQHYPGVPQAALGPSAGGAWLIALGGGLPGGLLPAGQSTVGHTVTVQPPGGLRVNFDSSIAAVPAPATAPVIDSAPPAGAAVGQPYV